MSQTFLILGVSILCTVSAHIFLKKGILSFGALDLSSNNLMIFMPKIFQNFWLIGGLFLIGISFVLWLFVISRIKLSLAYPMATSLNVSLIVLFSWLFLKEQLLPLQILGIVVIIIGIFLLLK